MPRCKAYLRGCRSTLRARKAPAVNRTVLAALGVVLLVVGLGVSFAQWASGSQPWGQLLGDNFFFARSLPFTIGLGIVLGYWKASGAPSSTERRAADGAIRRYS